PDLPSFPTRRSSDLIGQPQKSRRFSVLRTAAPSVEGRMGFQVRGLFLFGNLSHLFIDLGKLRHCSHELAAYFCEEGSEPFIYLRSEEHTSELQSRFD